MSIQLYIDYLSQPSRAVFAFCKLAKIPVEVHEIRVTGKEIRSENYKKINPMMKVPAIVDPQNGLQLAESHSVMRYLALKYPSNVGQWYPEKDLVKRAHIDQYMDFHHTNTRKCAYLLFNTLFAPKMGIKDPVFHPEHAKRQVETALRKFTESYIGKHKFVVSDEPTLADLSAYYQIQFLYLIGFDFGKWPRLVEWMLQMGKIAEVREANAAFIKLISKINPEAKI